MKKVLIYLAAFTMTAVSSNPVSADESGQHILTESERKMFADLAAKIWSRKCKNPQKEAFVARLKVTPTGKTDELGGFIGRVGLEALASGKLCVPYRDTKGKE